MCTFYLQQVSHLHLRRCKCQNLALTHKKRITECLVWVSDKFGTCTVVSVNGTLVEQKMLTTVQVPNLALPHTKQITVTGFIRGILRGVRYAKSLRVFFLHRRPPSWTTLVLYSRAVFIFNEPTKCVCAAFVLSDNWGETIAVPLL